MSSFCSMPYYSKESKDNLKYSSLKILQYDMFFVLISNVFIIFPWSTCISSLFIVDQFQFAKHLRSGMKHSRITVPNNERINLDVYRKWNIRPTVSHNCRASQTSSNVNCMTCTLWQPIKYYYIWSNQMAWKNAILNYNVLGRAGTHF